MSFWALSLAWFTAPPLTTVDINQAMSVALKTRSGFVVEAALDDEDGDPTWEVLVLRPNGRFEEVEVCAEEGKVLEVERVITRQEFEEFRPRRTELTAQKASKRAIQHRAGRIVEIEQDLSDDGRVVWDVYVLTRQGRVQELEFCAKTGDFLGLEDED